MDRVAELTGAALTRIERDFPVADDHRVDLADERAAAAWADTELPSMIALCRQAVDNEPTPAVWHLVDVVRKAASDRHRALWRRAAPVMLAAARRHERTDVVAVLELTLGVSEFRGGNTERGIRLLTDATASARRAGMTRGEANAEMNLGSALQWVGRLAEAVEHAKRAEEVNRQNGAHGGTCAALTLLVSVHRDRGDLAEAQLCGERAVALGAEHDLGFWEAAASSELGAVLMLRGQFARARELFGSALATMRRIGHNYGQLVSLRDLVELDLNEGRTADLHADALHCLDLAERDGDRTTLVLVLSVLGRIETSLGLTAQALETLARAQELADELGLRGSQVEVRAAVARALARADRAQDALGRAEEAVRLANGSGYRLAEADALTTLAEVRAVVGDADPEPARAAAQLWRAAGHVLGQRRVERLLDQSVLGR
jgi:tetratricopeptide (TPR) repeat protein